MASFRKRGDKWQARVHRKNHAPVVKTFHNKSDAQKWARNVETELDLGSFAPKKTVPRLVDVLARYAAEVTPLKKGASQEHYRAMQLGKTKLAQLTIDQIDGASIAKYRDDRLKSVSNNTVRLELALLSVVFEQCAKEWSWTVTNPVRQIRMPKPGTPRQRRLETGEEEALLAACKFSGAHYLHAFVVLAIETGMRFGELSNVCWQHVNLRTRSIHLADTKNGRSRDVPLSSRALAAIEELPRSITGRIFPAKPGSIRSAFLIAVKRAKDESGGKMFQGLRFHDLRHESVSRLLEKGLNPIEIAAISGHRTISMLARYAHPRVENLLTKLG